MTIPAYTPADIAAVLGAPAPTPEQAAVISAPLEPLLVVAGAGSGKTATMTQRICYLIANGMVAPNAVLGLTFTRKAAGELEARIATHLGELTNREGLDAASDEMPVVSTYNAFAAQIVADYGVRLGVDPSSRLITEAHRYQIVSDLVEANAADLATDAAASTLVDAVISLSEHVANHRILEGVSFDRRDPAATSGALAHALRELAADIETELLAVGRAKTTELTKGGRDVVTSLHTRAQLMPIVAAYAAYKREHRLLDFSDQILLARHLLEDPATSREIAGGYQAVFLDEFQDTSEGQVEMLSRLFASRGVTAVGDPNQAIYSWRGASQAALATFHTHFGGSETLVLSTAWRNDRAILDAANTVAAPLSEVPDFWDHEVADTATPAVTLRPRPGAGPGTVLGGRFVAAADEAQALAEFLEETWDRSATCAILVRTRAFLPLLAHHLREKGLPIVVDAAGLLDQPAIADVCAALHVTANAARGDHLARLLTNVGIGPADLARLWRWAGERARDAAGPDADAHDAQALLIDAVDSPPPVGMYAEECPAGLGFTHAAHARVTRLAQALRDLRHHAADPLPRLVERAVRVLDIDNDALANPRLPLAAQDLSTFLGLAADYELAVERPTLSAFLGWIETARTKERGFAQAPASPRPGAITLTTIHSAKGLEWDTVCVPFLSEKTFPTSPRNTKLLTNIGDLPAELRSDGPYLPGLPAEMTSPTQALSSYADAEKQRHLLEERRLAYVAFTRARSCLVLTSSWFADARGQATTPRQPSPFLAGIDADPLPTRLPCAVSEEQACSVMAERVSDEQVGSWSEPELFAPLRSAGEQVSQRATEWGCRPQSLTPERILAIVSGQADPRDSTERALFEGRAAPSTDPLGLATRVIAAAAERGRTESVRLPRRMTTTGLARIDNDEGLEAFLNGLRRPLPTAPARGADVGSRFHEAMAYVLRGRANGGTLSRLEDRAIDQLGVLEPDVAREVAALVRDTLADDILERYRPRHVEYDVTLRLGETLVAARLDAVMDDTETGRRVIVDWKTDRLRPDQAPEPAYITQLQIYRLALAETLGVDSGEIGMVLYYPRAGRAVDVEALVDQSDAQVRKTLGEVLERARARAAGVYLT